MCYLMVKKRKTLVNVVVVGDIVDGTKITVQIWDTAGQARCVGPTAAYYRRADCCVLVFDVTEPTTFDSLAGWRNSFLVDSNVRDHLSFPFVVVGNKVDQLNGRNDQMDFRKVIRWCQANNGIPYFHTSAKDGSRVDDAFQKIVQYAYDFNKKFSDVNRSSFMLVPTTTEQMDARISKEGCC
ncbi:hypothetical protein GE061_012376 [Apolygus lucorum]|uniref:Uncharacterized protein n=1 Tax=Apolygus lucorum TaxID=248454 RepID=A0A6A4JKQ8_APOLU|nr:hypothetical protein GE061_012376 [Apolygus lucorum]